MHHHFLYLIFAIVAVFGSSFDKENKQIANQSDTRVSLSSEKRDLGERLYPLVHAIDPKNAGKITGMLLELDNPSPLQLIQSSDALCRMVGEAQLLLNLENVKSPVQKKCILGERLYPLIRAIYPRNAEKITGMLLLSLDNAKLVHIIQSPEALTRIVTEAQKIANFPDKEKRDLGERLYPLVHAIDPKNAGKITGMLLELDNPSPLHLIQSSDALCRMVSEAQLLLNLENVASPVQKSASLASVSIH